MKLLSINISLPSDVDYQGAIVSTAIFKKPVAGKTFVNKDNVTGDQQVDLKNHGGEHKAVYAFSSDHYSYWRKVLQYSELKPGAFGENLTISDLDESTIHIGDQLSIGECVLEVTQPRVPCFKLGIAVGNKKMPRLFTEHFSTGVYLRVKQEGFIETGSAVRVINRNQFGLSVKSLFRAYFDKSYTESTEVMKKALLIPELSSEWREKLSLRLSALNCK